MKKLKFVVTGGAGLIGSWVVDKILAEYPGKIDSILVLDNFVRGTMDNLSDATKTNLVKIVNGDIRDINTVNAAIEGADYVIHEAAIRITQCAEDPRLCNEVLVDGTFNIFESCVKNQVKKLIFNSSASVYGNPSYLPMDEKHPFNNLTAYGAAKIANEQMARAFRQMYGLNYICIRPFNVYGPRMDIYGVYTEVLIRWMDRIDQGLPPIIHGDGKQSMDFVFVGDVAQETIKALKSDLNEGVYNSGTGIETNLISLLNLLLKSMGSALKPEFAPQRQATHVSRRQADVTNSKHDLGFTAETSLEEGLKQLISWRRQARLQNSI